jgi:IS5 family transposase
LQVPPPAGRAPVGLEAANLHLQSQGCRITTGTIVDVTIIHAPWSTKNRQQQRDPRYARRSKASSGISGRR